MLLAHMLGCGASSWTHVDEVDFSTVVFEGFYGDRTCKNSKN